MVPKNSLRRVDAGGSTVLEIAVAGHATALVDWRVLRLEGRQLSYPKEALWIGDASQLDTKHRLLTCI